MLASLEPAIMALISSSLGPCVKGLTRGSNPTRRTIRFAIQDCRSGEREEDPDRNLDGQQKHAGHLVRMGGGDDFGGQLAKDEDHERKIVWSLRG